MFNVLKANNALVDLTLGVPQSAIRFAFADAQFTLLR